MNAWHVMRRTSSPLPLGDFMLCIHHVTQAVMKGKQKGQKRKWNRIASDKLNG